MEVKGQIYGTDREVQLNLYPGPGRPREGLFLYRDNIYQGRLSKDAELEPGRYEIVTNIQYDGKKFIALFPHKYGTRKISLNGTGAFQFSSRRVLDYLNVKQKEKYPGFKARIKLQENMSDNRTTEYQKCLLFQIQ